MWASKGNEVFARKSARKFNIFIKKNNRHLSKNDYDGYFYIYRSE